MSDRENTWIANLKAVFKALQTSFAIQVNRSCSMHLHVKPVQGWHPQEVKSLAKAAAVFDDAITKIMPADRKASPWARSNFHDVNSLIPLTNIEKRLVAEFSQVGRKAWRHLFDRFDTRLRRNEDIPQVLGDQRSVSMNFLPVNNGDCGTIEFRRPPGVRTAQEAQRWAGFAVAFMSASLSPNWNPAADWSSKTAHATVKDLHSFLGQGLAYLKNATHYDRKRVMIPGSFAPDNAQPLARSDYDNDLIRAKLEKAQQQGSFEKVRL